MHIKTVKTRLMSFRLLKAMTRVSRGLLERRNRRNRKCPQSVWVHIGAHKTGTTLLQNQLLNNPGKLLPYSIGYDGESFWLGARLAADSPLEAEELKSLREKWQAQIKLRSESVVILSSEGLTGTQSCPWTNCAAVARDLKYILDGFDVRIVFCKRRLDTFYESLYQQSIKEGGTLTIKDFLLAYPPERFEWDKILGGYADCFGRDAIRVIDFDKAMENPSRYVEYAFGGFDVPFHFEVADVTRDNPSYNELGLQLALVCNPLLNAEDRKKLREFLQMHFPKQRGDHFSVLSGAERERLRKLDRDVESRLMAAYHVF